MIHTRSSIGCELKWKEVWMISNGDIAAGGSVRVNRLGSGGYSWTVIVSAAGESLEDLQRAKETALALSREMEDELAPKAAPREPDEVPF
jgi:hypothetical protein